MSLGPSQSSKEDRLEIMMLSMSNLLCQRLDQIQQSNSLAITAVSQNISQLQQLVCGIKKEVDEVQTLSLNNKQEIEYIKTSISDMGSKLLSTEKIALDANNLAVNQPQTVKQTVVTHSNSQNDISGTERSLRLIIRGLPEDEDEDLDKEMSGLFNCLRLPYHHSETIGFRRLGEELTNEKISGNKANNQPGTLYYGRPIMLSLAKFQQKIIIFSQQHRLRGHPKYGNIRILEDFDEADMLKYRVARQVCAAARKHTADVKLRGTAVQIDGKVIEANDFHADLPYSITPESAATIPTPDGTAFQGHASPLSNLYRCDLTSDGEQGSSVEHLYTLRMAHVCKAPPSLMQLTLP